VTQTVRIALNRPLRRLFDYTVPEGLSLERGQRVRVPFGRQSLTGMVVDLNITPPPGIALKPVQGALEGYPLLRPETFKLMRWAARYYQHPLGECLFAALPTALRRGRPAQLHTETFWHSFPNTAAEPLPKQAKKQRELLDWLQQTAEPVSQQTILAAGFSRAQLRALQARELASSQETTPDIHYMGQGETDALPPLSPEQAETYAALPDPGSGFSCTLLYGITGSGKTEIYLHYLKDHLSPEQQALVLVPEINLTPQTVKRFRRYFGNRIAVWHSALTDSERLQTWLQIFHGRASIIIGTRSAVTLPFAALGTIIVDEEHDTSFKQGEGFRYSARDLAVYRAHINHCPIILGSATPSIESYHNVQTSKYRFARLDKRANNARLPTVQLLDIRSRPLQGGIAAPTLQTIGERIKRHEQVLVFVNRRGYAPVMMCHDCGHMPECPRCDVRLTYHRRDRALRCHHCDYQTAATSDCPNCRSDAFKPIGQGTERAEDILQTHFPETPILRVDRDSTRKKGSIQSILDTVNTGKPCILVGTQMLAKGHDFPNVSLVVVVNADGGLFSTDFRAPEQLVQTLVQVSGRAGRGSLPGNVIIQTCHSDHPLLRTLVDGDYLAMAELLRQERATAQLPPFRPMAILRADAPQMAESIHFLDNAKALLPSNTLDIWGPLPAVLARRADRHRAQLVLLAGSKTRLNQILGMLCEQLESTNHKSSLKWQVDVDPLETG
jgi:primosomal protein N' (replication factor Y)